MADFDTIQATVDAILAALPTNLELLRIGRDGAVATSNRGYASHVPDMPEWIATPEKTYYVRTTGDDGNTGSDPNDDAFLTIGAAIAQKATDTADNAVIDVTGAMSISGSLVLPANVWLRGDGLVTMTYDSAGLITGGAWSGTAILTCDAGSGINITAGDDSVISGIKLISLPTASNGFSFPLGYKGAGVASKNVLCRDVWVTGDSDASYFQDTAACNGVWRHLNCIFDSKFDSTQIIGTAITHISEYWNCILRATGPTAVTGGSGDTRAITLAGGRIRTFNCMVQATGHITGKLSYGVLARNNARVEMYGGSVSGGDYDLYQSDNAYIGVRSLPFSTYGGLIVPLEDGLDWSKLRSVTAENDLENTSLNIPNLTRADLSLEEVDTNDTFVLVPTSRGFRNEHTKKINSSDLSGFFAVDFREACSVGQKASSVYSVEFIEGNEDNITIDVAEDWAANGGTQYNFAMTPSTAGDYRIRVTAALYPSGSATGDIVFEIVD